MRFRNGEHGYGAVTKALHWLTVLAFAMQFYVGYTMETEAAVRVVECDPPGERRSGGDTSDAEEERLDRLEEECEAAQERHEEQAEDAVGTAWGEVSGGANVAAGGLTGAEVHVLLGLLLMALALLRLLWRRLTPLPPWDPRLSPTDQRVVHATEVALLSLQLVVPATGILVVAGDRDLLWLHVTGHVAFFVALGAHLAMVLGRRLLPRMLPGGRASRPTPAG